MAIVAPAIISVLEIIIGLLNNVFIMSIIFYDFYKQKHMSSSNKILVCLNISNVSYGILISAGLLDEFLGLRDSSTSVLSSLYIILLICSISSCAWLTATLGAFYFVKISQIRCLSWIKFRISSIVPWMLVVSEVVSFIIGSFSSLLLIPSQISSPNVTDSSSPVMMILVDNRSGLINASLAVISIPFTAGINFIIYNAWTLRRHSHKMERSMENVDSGRLTSFERVVGRMTFFFFFYGFFYALLVIFYFSIISQIQLGFWVTLLLLCSFSPVQSTLLILGSPRFKDVLMEILHCCAFTRFLCRSSRG